MKTNKIILPVAFFTLLILGCSGDIDHSNEYETALDHDEGDLEEVYSQLPAESFSDGLTNTYSNTQNIST